MSGLIGIQRCHMLAVIVCSQLLFNPTPGWADETPESKILDKAGKNTNVTPQIDSLEIVGQRLNESRNGLSPDTGSTVFRFDKKDILALPLGDSTPLNQVILRAPGAVQDSFGQLHLRGDHGNLQYRVNGAVIPEAISGFGQALDTRFADQISILTGALPAQYGYRTAGVIDIQTKGASFDNTGRISLQGGSRQHVEGSAEAGGSKGAFTYFLIGSILRNQLGIENPTAEKHALHDQTRQEKSFGYLAYLLDNDSRVSFIFGTSNNKFEIPNTPGQIPGYILDNAPVVSSNRLDARQSEKNAFQILSYQATAGSKTDYQISIFHRDTNANYRPDPIGDLVFNGIAAQVLRRNQAAGLQGDFARRINAEHTLRTGIFAQRERFGTDNTARVFPADADRNQTAVTPITIIDNSYLSGNLFGIYLQDEWKPATGLTINYGSRFDRVNSVVRERQLSPRVGATYAWNEKTTVHAGYARYFTPPPTEKIDTTSVSKFLNTTNALPSDANTSVKSERSDYFDIGISYQPGSAITLGLDAYYRKVKHLQDEGQFGKALIFSAFNFGKARVKGVELTAAYREKNFSAYTNLTLSKAEATKIETGQFNFDGDELAFINGNWVHLDHDQKATVSAGMSYRIGATQLSGDVIYGSGLRKGFANTEHLPGYLQTNISVMRAFRYAGLGKIEGRLAIINLFDESYQLRDGTGIGVGAPQFAPRRTIYTGLAIEF